MSETSKLREIHQQYADNIAAAKLNKQVSAAYNNLNAENANPVHEAVRKAVLQYGEMGLLEVAGQYLQQALTVQASNNDKKKN